MKNKNIIKILFLLPYPTDRTASQRFRFEQYFETLEHNGIEYRISSFWGQKEWQILYKNGHLSAKIRGIIAGYIKRILMLFRLSQFSFVFIHRELVPIGPPLIEWILCKVFKKKILYDFDDAIWLPNVSDTNRFISNLKFFSSVKFLCKNSYRVSAGNEFLMNYARQFNRHVILNPTTIDTDRYHNRIKKFDPSKKIVLGWTGTHSTLRYLDEIEDVFRELEPHCDFELCVISDRKPPAISGLRSLNYVPWKKETEISDLLRVDIGLMPLTNDPWAHGKCGLKALQFMALGIPSIVSAVGVNTIIVDHAVNGFVCFMKEDWIKYVSLLISDRTLLAEMGAQARKKVEECYSVKSNAKNFLGLFS